MDVLKYIKSVMENLKMKDNYKKDNYKKDNYETLSPEDPADSGVYIDKIFERFGINIDSPEVQLNIRWLDIVGPELSKEIFYEKISNGTLFVLCRSSSYASFVRLNSKDIIKKVNSAFPELNIKKIILRVSPYGRF